MVVRVEFYNPHVGSWEANAGRKEEITVNVQTFDEAFEAACKAGGDPNRKMRYTIIES